MELVPEENNQIPNNGENHKDGGGDSKYIFSTLDVLETIGFVVFEGAGFALHEAEFHFAGYVSDFLGGWCGLLAIRHRMRYSKFERFAAVFYWSLLVISFLFFAFLSWSVSFKNSPQSTSPHFRFSICLASFPENRIYLTNDLRKITQFLEATTNPANLASILFFQRQSEHTNCTLRLFIENDSIVDADNVEVAVSFDGSWECIPDGAWIKQMDGNFTITENPIGIFTTNMFQTWKYTLPSKELLSGNGEELPPILISQPAQPRGFSIQARSKHSVTSAVGFQMFFPVDYNYVINKPFFMVGTNVGHGLLSLSFTSEKIQELLNQKIISPK